MKVFKKIRKKLEKILVIIRKKTQRVVKKIENGSTRILKCFWNLKRVRREFEKTSKRA